MVAFPSDDVADTLIGELGGVSYQMMWRTPLQVSLVALPIRK
jgi:hypothetical protein